MFDLFGQICILSGEEISLLDTDIDHDNNSVT